MLDDLRAGIAYKLMLWAAAIYPAIFSELVQTVIRTIADRKE